MAKLTVFRSVVIVAMVLLATNIVTAAKWKFTDTMYSPDPSYQVKLQVWVWDAQTASGVLDSEHFYTYKETFQNGEGFYYDVHEIDKVVDIANTNNTSLVWGEVLIGTPPPTYFKSISATFVP